MPCASLWLRSAVAKSDAAYFYETKATVGQDFMRRSARLGDEKIEKAIPKPCNAGAPRSEEGFVVLSKGFAEKVAITYWIIESPRFLWSSFISLIRFGRQEEKERENSTSRVGKKFASRGDKWLQVSRVWRPSEAPTWPAGAPSGPAGPR